jgi:hypothetical protein
MLQRETPIQDDIVAWLQECLNAPVPTLRIRIEESTQTALYELLLDYVMVSGIEVVSELDININEHIQALKKVMSAIKNQS